MSQYHPQKTNQSTLWDRLGNATQRAIRNPKGHITTSHGIEE